MAAQDYLNLVTSEHQPAARFMASLLAIIQPASDVQAQIASMDGLFDVDVAVGDQLDKVGLWIGQSRLITLDLTGVYFSFDVNGVGYDQGIWFEKYDPLTNQFALPDEQYRLLLYAKIAANNWDGSIPGAYAAWNKLFGDTNIVLIQDNQDMSMLIGVVGPLPDPLTKAILTGGYLTLKPAGVHINGYYAPTVPGAPFFGFDSETSAISGFDVGAWGALL